MEPTEKMEVADVATRLDRGLAVTWFVLGCPNIFEKRTSWASELTGPSMIWARQEIMTALVGKKVPRSKCGINNIVETAMAMAGLNMKGTCYAHQQEMLWCRLRHAVNDFSFPY